MTHFSGYGRAVSVSTLVAFISATGSTLVPLTVAAQSLSLESNDCGLLSCAGLSSEQQTFTKKLTAAKSHASVYVTGQAASGSATILHWDYSVNRWFATAFERYGTQDGVISRYVYDDNGQPQLYAQKSVHPTTTEYNWAWSDYGVAAGILGRANTDDFRLTLDGATGQAIGSENARALLAIMVEPTGMPKTETDAEMRDRCRITCNQATAELSFWAGAAVSVGCGLAALTVVGGIACGVIGGAIFYKAIDANACFNSCVSRGPQRKG